MVPMLSGWTLRRSPLAPSVPLEGSETVQGLRTLERLRSASLLQHPNDRNNAGRVETAAQSRRRQLDQVLL